MDRSKREMSEQLDTLHYDNLVQLLSAAVESCIKVTSDGKWLACRPGKEDSSEFKNKHEAQAYVINHFDEVRTLMHFTGRLGRIGNVKK